MTGRPFSAIRIAPFEISEVEPPRRPTWHDSNCETFARGYGPIRVDLRGIFAVLRVEIQAREIEYGDWLLIFLIVVPDRRFEADEDGFANARLSRSPWDRVEGIERDGYRTDQRAVAALVHRRHWVNDPRWTALRSERRVRRDDLHDERRALRHIHNALRSMMQHEVDEAIHDSTGAQPFDPHAGDRDVES